MPTVITTPPPLIHDTRQPIAAQPKLLDRVALACRARHYSLSTERVYQHWAKRFILWHGKRRLDALGLGELHGVGPLHNATVIAYGLMPDDDQAADLTGAIIRGAKL
jgi:Phage integrase, N-terminal SAM-like domain